MPNYCNNVLVLRDHKIAIDLFLDQVMVDRIMDFGQIMQVPGLGYLDDALEEDWCRENWGTKCNPFDVNICDVEALPNGVCEVRVEFQTAWTPAVPVIEKMLENQPLLWAQYNWFEPGWDIAGWIEWEKAEEKRFYRGDSSTDGYKKWVKDVFGYDCTNDTNHSLNLTDMCKMYCEALKDIVTPEEVKDWILAQNMCKEDVTVNKSDFEEAMMCIRADVTEALKNCMNEAGAE